VFGIRPGIKMPANRSTTAGGPVLAHLGEFFRAHRDDITRLWVAAVDRSPEITSSNDLTYRQLLDHFPQICDELADALGKMPPEIGTSFPTVPDAAAHGRKRWEQGYSLQEVIREICLLRRNIFDRWLPEFAETHPEFVGEVRRWAKRMIHQFFDDVIVDTTVQFAQENRDHASRAKREFLSRMSHDLRTPLTPLLLAAVSLKEQGGLSAEARDSVEMIVRNARVEAELVDQLLRAAEASGSA
jgi:signal transduction histidine kinase